MTIGSHRRSARRLIVGLTAALALAAAPAQRAVAAPTWSPPRALTTAENIDLHNAVAASPRGDSLVVWRDEGTRIQAIFRPAGEEYGTPRQLGDSGSSAPAVAMNGLGDSFAAWCRAGGVELAVRAAGHLFKLPDSTLGACSGGTGSQTGGPPAIAAGPDHTLLVVWLGNASNGCMQVMEREVRVSGTGYAPLGDAAPISSCPNDASEPRVAENASGAAAIAFSQDGLIRVASRAAGGAFSTPASVSNAGGSNPAIAVANDATGTVAAAWDDSSVKQVAATAGRAGQAPPLGAPVSDAAFATPLAPAVVFDAQNAAVLVWVDDLTGTAAQLRAAVKPPAGAFGAPQAVNGGLFASPSPTDPIRLAASPGGSAVVVFPRSAVIWAATRALGQPFATARPLSTAGKSALLAHVALDAQGNALATFSERVSGHFPPALLKAASYDAAGPTLRNLSMPASGMTGQVLTFAVSPFDVWSAFSTVWDFGDGTQAAGNTVQHAYAAAGTYVVRVAATDSVGNASSTQRAVAIASPPPPPVPDTDGDGFRDDQDCKPFDPRIHPGAVEIPEDRIDQNCDGRDELYPRIDPPGVFWAFNTARTRFTLIKLQFTSIPKGVRAYARCRGPHCPFKRTRTLTSRRSTLNLLKAIKKRKRHFRAGQTLEVVATRGGYMGRVVRVSLRKGQVPKSVRLCLRPGTTKPRACR